MVGIAIAGIVTASPVAASAQSSDAKVTANPPTVIVGQVTTVTATDLGGLDTAGSGVSNTDGASLSADGSTFGTSASSPVSNGSAQVYFKASEPGTYAVDVTDGETPIGNTTITVTADAPAAGAQLTAAPSTIAAGQPVAITAKSLGGLATATFGLGGGSSDAVLDPATAPVTDGTATTTFTASEPGTYTVDVTDGETPLAAVQVTVTAAVPAPSMTTNTPTSTPQPEPAPTDTAASGSLIWTIVAIAAVLLAAASVSILMLRRRRNGTSPTT